jgi:hypothetical protein
VKKSLRLSLLAVAVALPLAATTAFAATHQTTAPTAAAAGPTATQLLAKVANCTPASNGQYATDEGETATQVSGCHRPELSQRHPVADLVLHDGRQPEMDTSGVMDQ